MVQLLTTGEALDLFKSRVTLKQMEENKYAGSVLRCLEQAESHGSALVLFIQDPKLNRQATAMLGHWVPTELTPALIKLNGLIPSTVGWTKPAEPPTTEQLVDIIMEPIKKIADEFSDWKTNHPEEFAKFEQDKRQAETEQLQKQEPES